MKLLVVCLFLVSICLVAPGAQFPKKPVIRTVVAKEGSIEYYVKPSGVVNIFIDQPDENGWSRVRYNQIPLYISYQTDLHQSHEFESQTVTEINGGYFVNIGTGRRITQLFGVIYNNNELEPEGPNEELTLRMTGEIRGRQFARAFPGKDISRTEVFTWLGIQDVPPMLEQVMKGEARTWSTDFYTAILSGYTAELKEKERGSPPLVLPVYKKPEKTWTPYPAEGGYYFFASPLGLSREVTLESGGMVSVSYLKPEAAKLLNVRASEAPPCFKGWQVKPRYVDVPVDARFRLFKDPPTMTSETEEVGTLRVSHYFDFHKSGDAYTGVFQYHLREPSYRDWINDPKKEIFSYIPSYRDQRMNPRQDPEYPKLPEACDIKGGLELEIYADHVDAACISYMESPGLSIKHEFRFPRIRSRSIFSCVKKG